MERKENFLDQKIGEMAIYIINWTNSVTLLDIRFLQIS